MVAEKTEEKVDEKANELVDEKGEHKDEIKLKKRDSKAFFREVLEKKKI